MTPAMIATLMRLSIQCSLSDEQIGMRIGDAGKRVPAICRTRSTGSPVDSAGTVSSGSTADVKRMALAVGDFRLRGASCAAIAEHGRDPADQFGVAHGVGFVEAPAWRHDRPAS